jgi:hypothetical protein
MSRKAFALLAVMLVCLGVASFPRDAAGQAAATPLQTLLELVTSFGDVSRSWSAALPSAQRFVVLSAFDDDAVLDKNTGLVWQRAPRISERFWPSAQYACLNARIGGQMGWRLPSVSELASLVDPAATQEPLLPAGSPFDLDGRVFFWSATRRALFTDLAWGVDFRNGIVDDYQFFLTVSVWCVRGGTNSDEH